MAPPPIRIRVGAALDASVNKVFSELEARIKRIKRIAGQEFKVVGKEMATGADKAAKEWGKGTERMRQQTRGFRDESLHAFREIGRVAERELNRAARAQARAGEAFARRTSHRASRFLTPNAPLGSLAARAAGDVARGAGVDLSLGGGLQRNIALESAAIGLSQQERIATGGKTAGAGHFEGIARGAGADLAVDPTQVVELMRAFTGKTGEFSQIGEAVKRLAPQAVASGTAFQDMGEAAGFFYNQVKDLPDAMKLTEEGMAAIIGQTAVGSVEMPDFAKQMGRIAANARKFQGDRVNTIKQASALAQLSIESGGATSAADAARSVASFSNTFGKGARINAFRKHGVELFADPGKGPGKNTILRDQFDIIRESLLKTGGNIPDMAEMFADTLGRKPVTALANAFNTAGGGEKGIEAVNKMLAKYMNTMLTADAQQKNVADHFNSTAGRAQRFQNKLDDVTKGIQSRLLPALEKTEPAILKIVEVFGNLATWAVDNPKTAIAGAISLSIARAGIESTLRSGIERLILGASGGPGNSRAASVGDLAGKLGAGMTIASLAVTSLVVGTAIIDSLFDKSQEKQKKRVTDDLEAFNLEQQIRSGELTPDEAIKKTTELKDRRDANAAAARENATSLSSSAGQFLIGDVLGLFSKDMKEVAAAEHKRDLEQVSQTAKAQAEANALLRNLHTTLAQGITVKNMPPSMEGRATQ